MTWDGDKNYEGEVASDYPFLVMLVDDQPIVAKALRNMIKKEPDIDLHYCQESTEAVAIANQIKPTVILLDMVMPEVDGLTILRYLRANTETRSTPVVVLSSKEEPALKARAFAQGANDYLVKWPDAIELIARLRYHSKSYIYLLQRDEAYRALRLSQQELAEKNLELQRLASFDPLTCVANRRSLDEAMAGEWRRAMRQNSPLSLIMLDIDYFKNYNDHYGHQQGDRALQEVAAAVSGALLRPGDLVGRYGGEEFAVLLPGTGPEGVLEVAERIRADIMDLKIAHARSEVAPVVTVSLGVASVVPARGMTSEQFIEQADQALYRSKEQGRNQVVTVFLDSDQQAVDGLPQGLD